MSNVSLNACHQWRKCSTTADISILKQYHLKNSSTQLCHNPQATPPPLPPQYKNHKTCQIKEKQNKKCCLPPKKTKFKKNTQTCLFSTITSHCCPSHDLPSNLFHYMWVRALDRSWQIWVIIVKTDNTTSFTEWLQSKRNPPPDMFFFSPEDEGDQRDEWMGKSCSQQPQ